MIGWLDHHEGAALFFAAGFSGLVAIVALVTSWFTAQRAHEITKLGDRAEIGAILSITGGAIVGTAGGNAIAYTVYNIGRGAAEAVHAEFLLGGSHLDTRKTSFIGGRDMSGISARWDLSFGVPETRLVHREGDVRTDAPPVLRVSYRDHTGTHTATFDPHRAR